MNKRTMKILIAVAALALLAGGAIFLPSFYTQHLAWRLDNLRTSIYYFLHPPEKVVFLPTQPNQTPIGSLPTVTPIPTLQATEAGTATMTPPPLPPAVILQNISFVMQNGRWNYCGPANLSMALEYWGWKGEPGNTMDLRDQIAAVVKPGENNPDGSFINNGNTDVNVMPYELVDYVNDHTSLRALYRYGGDLELLKRLIAAGFPPIAEKGIYQNLPPENTPQWAGHYSFTTGYDDADQVFVWQDSYLTEQEPVGKNKKMSYAEYLSNWRAFDYLFIVVYPPEREGELMAVLGPWADETWAAQHALAVAQQESQSLTGLDRFFAEFNLGTSNGQLTDYGDSAVAYDYAFGLYNDLPENDRPHRILWYQTGPYKAYFYTSRYQDVINLAKATLATIYLPRSLEESWYWRAQAEYALGEYDKAYADISRAYYFNRNLQATLQIMQQWGVSP